MARTIVLQIALPEGPNHGRSLRTRPAVARQVGEIFLQSTAQEVEA